MTHVWRPLILSLLTSSMLFYIYRAALNAGRSSQEKVVCPSICLSSACIVTKRKKDLSNFCTIRKIIQPGFLRRRMVGGGDS